MRQIARFWVGVIRRAALVALVTFGLHSWPRAIRSALVAVLPVLIIRALRGPEQFVDELAMAVAVVLAFAALYLGLLLWNIVAIPARESTPPTESIPAEVAADIAWLQAQSVDTDHGPITLATVVHTLSDNLLSGTESPLSSLQRHLGFPITGQGNAAKVVSTTDIMRPLLIRELIRSEPRTHEQQFGGRQYLNETRLYSFTQRGTRLLEWLGPEFALDATGLHEQVPQLRFGLPTILRKTIEVDDLVVGSCVCRPRDQLWR